MQIYKITNLINKKFYIGQEKRNNPKYFGSGKLIQYAIKKYGKENFKKEIIQICETKEQLHHAEQFWIWHLYSFPPYGYNIAKGGIGFYGNHTYEAKLKIGLSSKGRIYSKEHNKKLSLKRLGMKFSSNHCANLSKSLFNNPKVGQKNKKNYMYGKNLYSIWLKKFGEEEANIKYEIYQKNCSIAQKNKRKIKLTNVERIEIFEAYISGKTRIEISTLYNVSLVTIKRIIKELKSEVLN